MKIGDLGISTSKAKESEDENRKGLLLSTQSIPKQSSENHFELKHTKSEPSIKNPKKKEVDLLGSVEYRDPFAKEENYSWESDIYSFAVIMWSLICSDEPWREYLEKHSHVEKKTLFRKKLIQAKQGKNNFKM